MNDEYLSIDSKNSSKEDNDCAGASIFSSYLKEIGRFPILTREEEICLFKRMHEGDELARERLIQCNLRLVVNVVKNFSNISSGMEMMDAVQEGNLGLMRALNDFDYTLGNKFSTYATFWIRQATLRGIHDKGYVIHIPVYYQERQYQLYRSKNDFVKNNHREPTEEELSKESGLSLKLIKEIEANQGMRIVGSLDVPLDIEKDDGGTLGDFISDDKINIEEIIEQKELRELLLKCLNKLSEKEQNVLKMRFGFEGDPMTLEEVGNRLGVTRERIRQIEAKSIRKLRNYKTYQLLEGYRPGY